MDRRIALAAFALTATVGCEDNGLRLVPAEIYEDEWATAELVLTDLTPAAYLEDRGGELVAADDLMVHVGDSRTEVLRIDEAGITVRLAAPLIPGMYDAMLRAEGIDHRAEPPLLVMSRSDTDGGGGDVDAGPTIPADWIDPAWTRRRRLTFDNSGQTEALDDFTVLVNLDDTRVDFGVTAPGGRDLRFYASDGRLLAHEIEAWNEPGAASCVWVRIPTITGVSAMDWVWMYYGNAGAPDAQDPAGTWHASYRGVWHLHGDSADSTAHANDGTEANTASASGRIADAKRLDGLSGWIDVGSDGSIDDLFSDRGATLSAMIYADGWGEAGYGRIIDKSVSELADDGWGWQLDFRTGTLRFERSFGVSGMSSWNGPPGAIALGRWHHVVVAYQDGRRTDASLFVDGVPVAVTPSRLPFGRPESDAAWDMRIGNRSGRDDRTFEGVIDEVRVASDMRSADWIAAQHLSLTDAFVTYGPEERL